MWKIFIREGYFQFLLAFLLLLFSLFYRTLGLPEPSELLGYFQKAYIAYGEIFIIVAAFFESFFMLSFYLPGSLILILAILNSSMNIYELFNIGLLALIGFTLANILNYIIGRNGLHHIFLRLGRKDIIERMSMQIHQNKIRTLFLAGFHPNFLSIAIVCMGITRENFVKTILISIFSQATWIVIWLVIAGPFISKIDFSNENQIIYFISLIILWGIVNGVIGIYNFKNYK